MEVKLNYGTYSSLEAAPHVVHKVNKWTRHTPPVEGADVNFGSNDDWLSRSPNLESFTMVIVIITFAYRNHSRVLTLTDELTMSLSATLFKS